MSNVETWATIPRFPGYEVSSLGRVRSLDRMVRDRGKELRPHKGRLLKLRHDKTLKHHYLKVDLSCGGKVTTISVHRLVCEAFHGAPPDAKSEACHGNDVGTDNRAENLRWGTRTDNERMKYRDDPLERQWAVHLKETEGVS